MRGHEALNRTIKTVFAHAASYIRVGRGRVEAQMVETLGRSEQCSFNMAVAYGPNARRSTLYVESLRLTRRARPLRTSMA